MTIRIGAVSYLNSKPLVFHLANHLPPKSELRFDLPSRLADDLKTNALDVALIPSIEFFSDVRYRIFSDVCIACRGPVWSVKIFFRTDPANVKTLALDVGSRTSVALAKILLADRYGIDPTCSILPIDEVLEETRADAVLLIGDRAMQQPISGFATEWDLGEEWTAQTGLPFVFAMWVGLHNQSAGEIERALGLARDEGVAAIDALAQEFGPKYGLQVDDCRRYFSENLHFTLGEQEMQGLSLFYQKASRLGLTLKGTHSVT